MALIYTILLHIAHLSIDKGTKLNEEEVFAYRRLIGRLIYLTNIGPYIYFSVNHLNRFVVGPTNELHQVVMCVHIYLKTTPGFGIFFHSSNTIR